MSTHPDHEQLSAYIDGELAGADRDDLEQHLTGCSDCSSTLRALRATVADMRALPSPVPSEHDRWALRSAIAKARRRPAERYRRWVVGAGSAAAVAAAIVGVLSLSHNKTNATFGQTGAGANSPAMAAPLAPPAIRIDDTNYNSTSARSLLDSIVGTVPANGPAPQAEASTRTTSSGTKAFSSADRAAFGAPIAACERYVLSSGSGGARPLAYIVGRYESTPAFFLIYSVVVGGKTKTEMWVVRRSDCFIRLFLAPR
jgi:hypothetical protein